jgi:hypothetical protein
MIENHVSLSACYQTHEVGGAEVGETGAKCLVEPEALAAQPNEPHCADDREQWPEHGDPAKTDLLKDLHAN